MFKDNKIDKENPKYKELYEKKKNFETQDKKTKKV